MQASPAPAAPNLPKKKLEKVGEEGPNPAQLALEKKAKKRLRVTEMPPGPERVVQKSRRKSPARAAEAGASNSAGCTGPACQDIPFIAEESEGYRFNRVFQHDVCILAVFYPPPESNDESLDPCIKRLRIGLKRYIPDAGRLFHPTHGIVLQAPVPRAVDRKNCLRFCLGKRICFPSPVICRSLRFWSGPSSE